MHTYKYGETTFICNSDLSGEVVIVKNAGTKDSETFVIEDGNDVIAFVADYVRRERISALEEASDSSLLGL